MHYEDVELEPVENGHKVTYTERSPREGASSMESLDYKRKEFVFSDKDAKKAFDKYLEVCKLCKNKGGGNMNMTKASY